MCLAIPGRILNTFADGEVLMARVDFGGVSKPVCIEHVPNVKPGDYILVHVGFAISQIDEEKALDLLRYIDELNEADG
jgi:hydrogenase expression/formation protein HypC